MPSLFSTDAYTHKTKVLSLDEKKTYMPVSIEAAAGGPDIHNWVKTGALEAIVTGINVNMESRTQFTPTLGIAVYAYTFGENLVDITISGLGYTPCGTEDPTIDKLIKFWDTNNVGKHGKPCRITINKTTYKAYLLAGEIGESEQLPGMYPFKFVFKGVLA